MSRHLIRLLLCYSCLLSIPGIALERGPVFFSVEVEPGKWQALEVRNLPARTELSIDISGAGSLTAAVVNRADMERFPDVEEPLFIGAVQETLNFSVTTPADDFYYVVIFNNSERNTRKVELVVRARRLAEDEAETGAGLLL